VAYWCGFSIHELVFYTNFSTELLKTFIERSSIAAREVKWRANCFGRKFSLLARKLEAPAESLSIRRDTIFRRLREPLRLEVKELILNADDFGLTRGVNAGIIRAHREGILTSATLMATAPAVDDAVELAKAHPKLGVGCHLVLTGGLAAAPPSEIPSLADKEGRLPESLAALVYRVTFGAIRTREMEIELRAQIEKIRRAGIEPTHVDTHKHTHVHPRVMRAVGKVTRDMGIARVRNPIENLHDSWRTARREHVPLVKNMAASSAVRSVAAQFGKLAREYGLRSPDYFLGLAITGEVSTVALRHLIENLPEGRTEIMLHPGLCDDDLRKTRSRLQEHREKEMESLLAPEVRQAVAESRVRLISYRDLN
jgi:chitin disaccharide deacetylase